MGASQVDLSNGERGFRHKSTWRLRASYVMFFMMKYPLLVKIGPNLLVKAMKVGLPINAIVKSTLFNLFCGGESIKDTKKVVDELAQYGVGSILDFALEGVTSEEHFDKTLNETLANIDFAAHTRGVTASVLKFSGIASHELLIKKSRAQELSSSEMARLSRANERIDQICAYAQRRGVTLMVDAEESWVQPAIDMSCEWMMRTYNREKAVVYTTLQLYRNDRIDYLHKLYQNALDQGFHIGIKLVRGAYLEKEQVYAFRHHQPSPLHASKELTDHAYDEALAFCVEHHERIHLCAGTHNARSIERLLELMEAHHISPSDPCCSFSQLLGMGETLTFNLAEAGYRVAKYVPYGPIQDLLPYLSRRIEENSAIRGQSAQELQLIKAELLRRK